MRTMLLYSANRAISARKRSQCAPARPLRGHFWLFMSVMRALPNNLALGRPSVGLPTTSPRMAMRQSRSVARSVFNPRIHKSSDPMYDHHSLTPQLYLSHATTRLLPPSLKRSLHILIALYTDIIIIVQILQLHRVGSGLITQRKACRA